MVFPRDTGAHHHILVNVREYLVHCLPGAQRERERERERVHDPLTLVLTLSDMYKNSPGGWDTMILRVRVVTNVKRLNDLDACVLRLYSGPIKALLRFC
jgi:hypothetical protein